MTAAIERAKLELYAVSFLLLAIFAVATVLLNK